MKILITGGEGQLGTDLKLLLDQEHDVYAWDIEQLDITQGEATINKIIDLNPEVVINTAAYTDVDGCEENIDLAYQVNTYGVRNVAVACQKCGAKLAHISTDFVFGGDKQEAYFEFDKPDPINIYGKSKLAGEKFVQNLCNNYFILRTSWLYGIHGDNFVKTILNLAEKKERLDIVNDQIGTPTYAKDLSKVIEQTMQTELYGTYHVSNTGKCSWYEFAQKIFEYAGIKIEVEPVISEEFSQLAGRPKYSVMKNYSLKQSLGLELRNWKEALKEYLKQINYMNVIN